jgi:hypothetical protein
MYQSRESSPLRPGAYDVLADGLWAANWNKARTYRVDSSPRTSLCPSPLTPACYPHHGWDEYEYWRERLEMLHQDVQGHNTNDDFEDRRRWIGDSKYWQVEAEHWKKLFEDFRRHLLGQGLLIPSEYQLEDEQLRIDTEWGKAIGNLNFRHTYDALDLEDLERMPRVAGSRTLDRRARISDRLLYQIAARHWEVLCEDMAGIYICLKAVQCVEDYRKTIRNTFYWQTEFDALDEALQKLNRANAERSPSHDNLSSRPDSTNLQLPNMGNGYDQEGSVVSARTEEGYEAGTELPYGDATKSASSHKDDFIQGARSNRTILNSCTSREEYWSQDQDKNERQSEPSTTSNAYSLLTITSPTRITYKASEAFPSRKAENQMIWLHKLRSRCDGVVVSLERPKAAERPAEKPKGIVKQYGKKALRKKQPAAWKGPFNKSSPTATPARVTNTRGIKSMKRYPRPSQSSTARCAKGLQTKASPYTTFRLRSIR